MLIFTESARGEELGQGQDQEADQGHEEADQGQLLIQQSMVLFLPKINFLNFESWNFDEFFFVISLQQTSYSLHFRSRSRRDRYYIDL